MSNYVRKEVDKYGSVRYYNDKGQLSWTDGPACEYGNGSKEWRVDGNALTEEQWLKHPLVIDARVGKAIDEVLKED